MNFIDNFDRKTLKQRDQLEDLGVEDTETCGSCRWECVTLFLSWPRIDSSRGFFQTRIFLDLVGWHFPRRAHLFLDLIKLITSAEVNTLWKSSQYSFLSSLLSMCSASLLCVFVCVKTNLSNNKVLLSVNTTFYLHVKNYPYCRNTDKKFCWSWTKVSQSTY